MSEKMKNFRADTNSKMNQMEIQELKNKVSEIKKKKLDDTSNRWTLQKK